MSEEEDLDAEGMGRITALDLEDDWEAEAKRFSPAQRHTEADTINDKKSVERCLDKSLMLLVLQQLGRRSHWVLPQGPRLDGESMRQTAERVMEEHCGKTVKAQFLGNAPCGFYQYYLPASAKMGTGVKVFFFKAWYDGGDVTTGKDASDHTWLTKQELSSYCLKPYARSVKQFIVDA